MQNPSSKQRWLLACALLLFGARAAAGQRSASAGGSPLALDLEAAQTLALQRSPAFAAARQEVEVAAGELRTARQVENPELELEAPAAAKGSLGTYQLVLGQPVEIAGQRGLRIRAAERGLAAARAELQESARQLLLEVSDDYLAVAAAQQRAQLAERLFELNRRLLAAVRTQLREGGVSGLDGNLAEIESGRSHARVLAARRELVDAKAALSRNIGLAADIAFEIALPAGERPATVAPLPQLVDRALRQRPDLAARRARVEQAEAALRLARREAIPNLTVGPMWEGDRDIAESHAGVFIGMPLPLWNRNQGVVAQREAELDRARYQLSALELAIRSEVSAAHAAVTAAREEVEVFRRSVLEPVRDNQHLLEIAYQGGKINLPSLLLVRNQLLEAETEYWDSWLVWQQARIRLRAASADFDPTSLASSPAESQGVP